MKDLIKPVIPDFENKYKNFNAISPLAEKNFSRTKALLFRNIALFRPPKA
jgi:hypothetical protein